MPNQHETNKAQDAREPAVIHLYHFTRAISLAEIVASGIHVGEVPVTPYHVIQFPWFTHEFSHQAQSEWVDGDSQKMALRLEVEFDQHDENLVNWRDYASRLNIRQQWYDAMTGPSRNGRDWQSIGERFHLTA